MMEASDVQTERKRILCRVFEILEAVLTEESPSGTYDLLLESIGTNRDQLKDGASHLSFAKYMTALRRLSDQCLIPSLGAKLGSRMDPNTFGVFGLGMITGTSFTQQLKLSPWLTRTLWWPNLNLTIERGTSWMSARLHLAGALSQEMATNLMDEVIIAGAKVTQSCLPNVDPGLCEVLLAHPAPRNMEIFKHISHFTCRFDQPYTELRFPAAWAERSTAMPNETISRYCEEICLALSREYKNTSVAGQIRELLVCLNLSQVSTLEDIAYHLGMTARSMRAALSQEGVSFRELLAATRLEQAKGYLRNSTNPIKEIAYQVGFAHLSNFSRSFSRATGQSPESYRGGDATTKVPSQSQG